MKRIFSLTAVAVFALVVVSSCGNKNKDNTTTTPTTTTSVKDQVTGIWKIAQYALDSNSNNKPDDAERTNEDEADQQKLEFKADGSGISTGLDNGVPKSTSFKWSLLNSDKTLMLVDDGDTFNTPIYSITSSEFIIESADNDPTMPKEWLIMKK